METKETVERKPVREPRTGRKRRRYRFEEKLKAVRCTCRKGSAGTWYARRRVPEVFTKQADASAVEAQAREKELYEEIGRLKMQLEWLKKTWPVWGLRSAVA